MAATTGKDHTGIVATTLTGHAAKAATIPTEGGYNSDRPRREGGYNSDRPRREGGYKSDRPRREGDYNSDRPRREGGYNSDKPRRESTARKKEQAPSPKQPKVPGEIRLNRFIANSGLCSRREADIFIETGLVTVNGQAETRLGVKVMATDDVRVNDQRIKVVHERRRPYRKTHPPFLQQEKDLPGPT